MQINCDENITITERIIKVIENEGITKYKFCKDLGVSKGFLDKPREITTNTYANILEYLPNISPEWLLTGKGDMRDIIKLAKSTTSYSQKKHTLYDEQITPLYNLTATTGLRELFDNKTDNIIDTIKIPNLPKCDGGILISGDSMYPLLKSGDIILYKEVTPESIFWGEMYLIGFQIGKGEEYVSVRYIQKSEKGENSIKLVSQNQQHSPQDIKTTDITALALIKASIRTNTMM